MRKIVQRAALCAAAYAVFGAGSSAHAQHTWVGTASGVWSDPANWSGGNVPPVGGAPGLAVTFTNKGAATWSANNDRGNPFALNTLTLRSFSSGLGTLVGDPLAFNGAGASISNAGVGNWTLTNAINLNADVTLAGPGPGNTLLSGAISGTGGIVVGAAQPANNLTN